jgi:hypothetical protein
MMGTLLSWKTAPKAKADRHLPHELLHAERNGPNPLTRKKLRWLH